MMACTRSVDVDIDPCVGDLSMRLQKNDDCNVMNYHTTLKNDESPSKIEIPS